MGGHHDAAPMGQKVRHSPPSPVLPLFFRLFFVVIYFPSTLLDIALFRNHVVVYIDTRSEPDGQSAPLCFPLQQADCLLQHVCFTVQFFVVIVSFHVMYSVQWSSTCASPDSLTCGPAFG